MVGFSDSECESGTSALNSVDKSIQLQRALATKYGIQYGYFGGAGGDIERGEEGRVEIPKSKPFKVMLNIT